MAQKFAWLCLCVSELVNDFEYVDGSKIFGVKSDKERVGALDERDLLFEC